jgi:pyruvate/2-oxoglutarate dehydrogenase complex dihydrolipoamide dehydrogenase (E3) component
VGWPGNVDGLGLDAAGVETEGPYIRVDDRLCTTAGHIYAAGDINGKMMLVQTASYQARLAVENALADQERSVQNVLLPHGGFTDPEYGGVGLTEAQAREQYDVAVAVVPYSDLDRGVIDGHTDGFCKLVVDRQTQRVLGAHVVGEQALEVVQMVATGMSSQLTVEELMALELAYPTFASIIGLAARQLVREFGRMKVSPEWRSIQEARPTEWERRE